MGHFPGSFGCYREQRVNIILEDERCASFDICITENSRVIIKMLLPSKVGRRNHRAYPSVLYSPVKFVCYVFRRGDSGLRIHVYVISTALVPGKVQNLRSTLDVNVPTLTLHWDKPKNITTDGDVKSYDIRFKPCGREGNYHKETVVAPATSILLTRESGLKLWTKYDFEIRAQNSYQEGKWTKHSKYIGKFIVYILCLL